MTEFVSGPGKPADPSKIKPVYLVVAEDPESPTKNKLSYYKTGSISVGASLVELRGYQLCSKEQRKNAEENPREVIGKEINVQLPINRIVRIITLTYKKGEKQ